VQRKEQKQEQYWVLKVSADNEKDCFFRFYGDKAEKESLKVLQLLKTEVSPPEA
jgi:hypothetical protein